MARSSRWNYCCVLSTLASLVAAIQPSAPSPLPAPLRDLEWGAINFLHTTDTHGWHAGHLEQYVHMYPVYPKHADRVIRRASYAADWGDYISFAHHMRRLADEQGRDLLVVDTGDRIEGNGLYDASDPKGKYTFDIVSQQHIDVLCAGNHELYKQNSSENEFNITVPAFKGHYLASNLDIHDPVDGHVEPLAQRFRKFKTKKLGLTVTAFGFLYDFKGNYNNTIVKPVADVVQEDWFKNAIRDRDTDLFLVIGHVPADGEEFTTIFNAIRAVQWDKPIQFFAGHTHIRDFKRYDKMSTAMESGRYMETIGFLSIDGVTAGKRASNLKIHRRYIDNNLYSMWHHTSLNETTFPTQHGLNVSKQIQHARSKLHLDKEYGCAPQDLWMDRVPVTDDASIYKWLSQRVLPDQFKALGNSSNPLLVLSNTGAIRFDIFKGSFTVDSAYLVSPFTSGFRQIQNIDYRIATKLLGILNNNGQVLASAAGDPALHPRALVPPDHIARRRRNVPETDDLVTQHTQIVLSADEPPQTPGYITHDDDGDDGDDTVHAPLPFVRAPNCVQSEVGFPDGDAGPATVDVVYNEYIEQWVLLALQFLGAEYSDKDTQPFRPGKSMTDVIADWVRHNWHCKRK